MATLITCQVNPAPWSGSVRPMPIKIVKQGDDLYTAEVTAPNGTWRSPRPMPNDELGRELLLMGYDPVEIRHALEDAGVVTASHDYRETANRIRPLLQSALAGEREVPEQSPITEAWLALALSRHDGLRSLKEVIGSADAVNAIPNPDEISWAFLRLRKRGWLAVDGDMYGLTPEGHRAVKEIVDRGEPPRPGWSYKEWLSYMKTGQPVLPRRTWSVKKLEDWILENPPPGDE